MSKLAEFTLRRYGFDDDEHAFERSDDEPEAEDAATDVSEEESDESDGSSDRVMSLMMLRPGIASMMIGVKYL